MAEEVRNDWLPLQSADPSECVAPALLTISVEMIRFAAGALRAEVTSTAVCPTDAREAVWWTPVVRIGRGRPLTAWASIWRFAS